MRELIIQLSITDLRALGLDGLTDCCQLNEAARLKMESCQHLTQSWVVTVDAPIRPAEVERSDCIEDARLLHEDEEECYEFLVVIDRSESPLLSAPCACDVMCHGEIRPGKDLAQFELVAPEETIRRINQEMSDGPFHSRLVRIGEYSGKNDVSASLTPRQEKLIKIAYERGYYEVPRSVDLNELAQQFDLDKSTVSEHLRRAERNILTTVLPE